MLQHIALYRPDSVLQIPHSSPEGHRAFLKKGPVSNTN
jgi:hypothetical protein